MSRKDIVYRNFESHEKQRAFIVFYFHGKDPADYFESLLIEHDVPYERGDGKDIMRRHLFGIHRKHQLIAEKLNNETGNFFRKPFLSDNMLRYAVLIFTLIVVVLAIVGFFLTKFR